MSEDVFTWSKAVSPTSHPAARPADWMVGAKPVFHPEGPGELPQVSPVAASEIPPFERAADGSIRC